MAFFQNSVLNKHLNGQDAKTVKDAYQKFTAYFHNPAIQQNIRDAKEEQFQEGFLRELFVDILGYTLNPQPNFNLTTELKNEKGAKKADGAILQGGKALGVIELKGTDTKDLDKINVQAFNYKNNQTGCVYVITSNFEKLRFFIHHSVEHLEFNLFTLTETEFQLLWLCLRADNLLSGVPLKVKEESLLEEEKITKQLYKDYAAFRYDLWQNMVKNSRAKDKLLLFKKTQKLLDRYLFIFFAEDSGLLPPNSISRIVKRWEVLKQEDAYKPLYDIFKQYFGYIDTGRKGQKTIDDIFAYNGGLFQPDEVLDNIVLDDEMLHPNVMKLTKYDFQSEVDVNILGHIFENSLNEIENITAELEGQEIDKSKTKRKKDGVFYTPKYITKYIVDNTVGKLCEEKKAELGIIDEEYAKGRRNRKKETIKSLDENLQAYRNWLLNITICDPACGSGAFLNQALEFLIDEHAYIDELESQLLGNAFEFPGVENHILEKNIYGVDINEESVDIAKLSLWLRTAQRGRKLTTLNNNIKCGNSLIDDPAVAGEKAFNWQKEFPTVFAKGGFDVVIGNPPYVSHERVGNKKYLAYRYESHQGFADLFCYFYELGIKLLKNQGLLSFITSNSFLKAEYGAPLRTFLIKNTTLLEIINVEDAQIFSDAIVNSSILTLKRGVNPEIKCLVVNKKYDINTSFWAYIESNKFFYQQSDFDELPWKLITPKVLKIRNKIKGNNPTLEDLGTKIRLGIATGSNEAFIISEELKNELIAIDSNSQELIKPMLRGKDIERFYYNLPPLYLLLTKNGIDVQKNYPAIFNHLDSFGESFKNRGAKGQHWTNLRACSFFEDFKKDKIVWIELTDKGRFSKCIEEIYLLNSAYFLLPPENFTIGYLLTILNSKLIKFYLKQIANTSGVGTTRWINIYVKEFPVFRASKEKQLEFNSMEMKISEKLQVLIKLSLSFSSLLETKFEIEKLTTKLQNWYELEFKDFLKELKKVKAQLSLSEEAEWMQYFNEQKQKAQALKSEIDKTDREIDRMVYELYGLSEEEIAIVENSTK